MGADTLELCRQTATRMPVPLAISPVASWEVYDLCLSPRDLRAIDSRVLKYTTLTNNLTKMVASVHNLHRDPGYQAFFVPEVMNVASRLTWIMLYFYGAMSHYSS